MGTNVLCCKSGVEKLDEVLLHHTPEDRGNDSEKTKDNDSIHRRNGSNSFSFANLSKGIHNTGSAMFKSNHAPVQEINNVDEPDAEDNIQPDEDEQYDIHMYHIDEENQEVYKHEIREGVTYSGFCTKKHKDKDALAGNADSKDPSCFIIIKQGKGKEINTITGVTYEGEYINNFKFGFGKETTTSQKIDGANKYYEGLWLDGKKDGEGTLVYDDKFTYKGSFKDDKKHGFGIMTKNDDGTVVQQYEGNWELDKKCGQGKQKYSDGGIYEGQFKDNVRNGQGTITYPNNNTSYKGLWLDDQKTGPDGVEVLEDESQYIGEYLKNQRHGNGKQTMKDKSVYTGRWISDSLNEGSVQYADGSTYEGQFEANLQRLRGSVFDDRSRLIYKGMFARDKMNGLGLQIDYGKTGITYTGNFEDGVQIDELASVKFLDKRTYVGGWHDGMMHGEGELTWPDGQNYNGWFLNNKMDTTENGEQLGRTGHFIWADNAQYKGAWKEDGQDGNGTKVNKNGIERDGFWENGKRKRWTSEVKSMFQSR